jgi:hypothetical protein
MNDMYDEVEGSDRGLSVVLSQHLRRGTANDHENPQSGWQVSRPKFEPGTCRIRVYRVTSTSIGSVLSVLTDPYKSRPSRQGPVFFCPCTSNYAKPMQSRKNNVNESVAWS